MLSYLCFDYLFYYVTCLNKVDKIKKKITFSLHSSNLYQCTACRDLVPDMVLHKYKV